MSLNLLAGRLLDRGLDSLDHYAPSIAFKIKKQFYRPDMGFALELLRRSNFAPRLIVDVGAFHGDWATLCLRSFPEARVLMVEPDAERVRALALRAERDQRLSVRQALLGASTQVVAFREQESNSAVVGPDEDGATPMTTVPLDDLVATSPFAAPQLLKVDVQGYDLEVLKGATRTLHSVEVIVVEISLIRLAPTAPSVLEIVVWLDAAGFRLFDICSFIRRPIDDALWQIDAVFVRHDSALGHPSRGW